MPKFNAPVKGVHNLADNPKKDTVLYINDYFDEYGKAFKKLSEKLGRPLRGIILVDKTLKQNKQNLPDTTHLFEEIVCDFSDDAEIRSVVKGIEDRLLLVSCSAESSQMDFKRILPHLPYVLGPTEKSLEWATHKGKMREVIGAYSPDLVPKVQSVNSAEDDEVKKVLDNLSFPMIIKPTGLSDSTLVTKVHNRVELQRKLEKAFAVIDEIYKKNRGNGKPGIIVEEFMSGDLYSIDGYVDHNGKVWLLPLLRSKSAYQVGLEGFYIYQTETHHNLTEEQDKAGRKATEDAIKAVGLRSSVAHVELFNTADGWKIIELGARPGALRQEVYEKSYGVDHALNELLIKIGLTPEINDKAITQSMIFKIYPGVSGQVKSISGIKEAQHHPSLYKMMVFTKRGEKVLPNNKGGSVAVQGLLFNDDYKKLRNEVAYVRSIIKINTDNVASSKVNELHTVA